MKKCLLMIVALLLCASAGADSARLHEVLGVQPESVQVRFDQRHPAETLQFFEIEPGMTVMEALPGGGWYSKILIDYLGPDGALIGADYAEDMWPLFGFFGPEMIESKKTWVSDWSATANGWVEGGAPVSAFQLGSLPEALQGTADRVVMVRALHNMARFESRGGYLSDAMADAFAVLKAGGIAGIVQHEAREDMNDEFASGGRGYLKKKDVIARMEAAGFEFLGESRINQNLLDQPGEDDTVWRLPPTLQGSADNPQLREEMVAIGESHRMTLKFRKP